MNLLLDTHAFLYLSQDFTLLGPRAQAELRAGTGNVLLSICSVWEMAVKIKLGKLQMDLPLQEAVEAAVQAGLQVLDLRVDAVCRTLMLDLNHRDPFDRILAAQALTHGLTIVSRDPFFDAWAVPRIW